MKVFDCFNYNGEAEMLDIRLNTLDSVVDYFVITESNLTFSGLIKPIWFLEQKEKFKKFLPKIVLHTMETVQFPDAWYNEYYQRNNIWLLLNKIAQPEDAILYSGIDEIPDPKVIKNYLESDKLVFMMRPCYYYINVVNGDEHNYLGTILLKKRTLDIFYLRDPRYMLDECCLEDTGVKPHGGVYWAFENFGLTYALQYKFLAQRIEKAGWHYQWYGDEVDIAKKMLSYSHTDQARRGLTNQVKLRQARQKLETVDPKMAVSLKRVDLNSSVAPDYVLQNPEKFRIFPK